MTNYKIVVLLLNALLILCLAVNANANATKQQSTATDPKSNEAPKSNGNIAYSLTKDYLEGH